PLRLSRHSNCGMARMLSSFEGVADGGADARGVRPDEVRIVIDPVDSRFGTDEEPVLEIQFDTAAEVCVEVTAAGDFAAAAELLAVLAYIEVGANCSNAADEFQVGMAG